VSFTLRGAQYTSNRLERSRWRGGRYAYAHRSVGRLRVWTSTIHVRESLPASAYDVTVITTFRGPDIVDKLPGDVAVLGIRWTNDQAVDVVIHLGVADWHGDLICRQAIDLEIHMDQRGYIGVVPTWDVTISPRTGGGWVLSVDVSPVGEIKLNCDDIELQIEHTTSPG
jgi:hypothetical protein